MSILLLNEGDFSVGNDNDKKYRSRFGIDVILNQIPSEIYIAGLESNWYINHIYKEYVK